MLLRSTEIQPLFERFVVFSLCWILPQPPVQDTLPGGCRHRVHVCKLKYAQVCIRPVWLYGHGFTARTSQVSDKFLTSVSDSGVIPAFYAFILAFYVFILVFIPIITFTLHGSDLLSDSMKHHASEVSTIGVALPIAFRLVSKWNTHMV